jgi:hypothetical protein
VGSHATETQRFDAHGVRFVVTSTDPEVVAAFDDLLSDLVPADNGAAGGGPTRRISIEPTTASDDATAAWYRVAIDDDVLYPTLLEGSVVSHVLMRVNALAAASCRAAGAVALHAGAAAGSSGAVLLPGASHSGKTTLTAALAVAGHRFVADEVSRLDPDALAVTPYGKPVALRPASARLLAPEVERLRRPGSRFETDERFVPPSDLGTAAWPRPGAGGGTAGPVAVPVPVAAVVFPRFDAECDHRFAPLGPAEVLERLMQCTLGSPSDPVGVATFRALERLARTAPGHELVYRDLDDALADLLAL